MGVGLKYRSFARRDSSGMSSSLSPASDATPFTSKLAAAITAFVLSTFVVVGTPTPVSAQTVPEITLPIAIEELGMVRWTDTWGAPRSGGRSHVGVDIIGPKMTKLVAAADGTITWMRHNSSRGNIIYLTDDDGWQYTYIHINNDTPGTDDGANHYDQAFAPGIERGVRVEAGQVIAYMGDSGNAEWTVPHLHFEIVSPDGQNINPAPIVDAARDRALRTVPEVDPALVAPFTDFEVFADNLFGVVHGRSATNAELQALADLVINEGLEAALASVITPSSAGASLDRLYEAYFLRRADAEGFNYWMNQFRAGAELSEIAEWFADSEEFQTRYSGLEFGDFLDQLYRDVLDREPDEGGKRYWLDLLEDGQLTRGSIVVQFTESAELIAATEHRSEITMLSLVFTQQIPNGETERLWESLRLNADVQASLSRIDL